MITLDDILTIQLPTYAVELAHYQAYRKMQTVGNDGDNMKNRAPHNANKDPREKQIDQMLSELAFAIFLFGFRAGIDHFMKERDKHNLNPHVDDGGHDMIIGVDVKSRRKTNLFNFAPINANMLNYDLLLRTYDLHDTEDHIYIQAIQEYNESLIGNVYIPQTATVWLTGWSHFSKFKHHPNGLIDADGKIRITGEVWTLKTQELTTLATFPKTNIPLVKESGEILRKPNPVLLPVPN